MIPHNLSAQSSRVPIDRFIETQMDSGRWQVRRISNFIQWEFNLVWEYLSTAEANAILAKWNAEHEDEFEYVWPLEPNRIFMVHFLEAPQVYKTHFDFWTATVKLSGHYK